jgi:plastocyanin
MRDSMQRTLRPAAIAAALTLIALVAVACGGSDEPREANDPRIPAGAPFVDQDRLRFIPTSLETRVGETIYFKNSETALHTVDVNGENLSGNMRRNDIFVWTPEEAGTYRITCEYHPQMRATITVVEATAR